MSANTHSVWGDRLSPRVDEPDAPHTIAGDDGATAMGLLKGLLFQSQEQQEALDLIETKLGSLVTAADGADDYLADVLAGNVFEAHNVAAQAVSVALTTTYTGLCVSNPIASQVNLVVIGCNYALSVAPAGIASLHLLSGYSTTTDVTHGTPLAAPGIQNCKVGSSASGSAKADSAATTVNPTYRRAMGSGFTAGALYGTTPSWIRLRPVIVVPPGGWVAWGALTAVTGFGSIAWKEVPIE